MPSPLDIQLAAPPKGAPRVAPPAAAAPTGAGPLALNLAGPTDAFAAPATGQLARAAWNQGGQTLQIQPGAMLGIPGTLNTHIPMPQWLEHRLIFQGRALHDVGQGIENTGRWIGDKLSGQPYQPPAQTSADRVMAATEQQHPAYNYLVKWPTEFAASLPLGEGAGELAGTGAKAAGLVAPEGASLLTRAAAALPRSMAMGAAYGVQQPGGSPGANAILGAAAGPVMEAGGRLVGKGLGFAKDAITGLYGRVRPQMLDQQGVDRILAQQFAERGLPAMVMPRPTLPGVSLPTAVHSGDPNLLAVQSAERTGNIGQDFNQLSTANDQAIRNSLRTHFAPNADSPAVSDVAHQMLLDAQERARGVVRAAYAPFDAAKNGVYLERGPVQKALREAYDGLLPAHREVLPAKVQEVMNATGPLHLTNDIEDLGARLSDAIGNTPPGTPASRALMMMRDALNKGVEDAPLANQPELGALNYDPARNPLPGRNMAAPDPREDSILQFMAKHPQGLSFEEGAAQGLDPADLRGRLARVGIRRAFRQGGMGFDQAAETLAQHGYPVVDAHGNYDPNALLNAIDSELRGKPVFSAANTRQAAEVAHDAATETPPMREPPSVDKVAALAEEAGKVDPERAAAVMDGWTDDTPETLARVHGELQAIAEPPQHSDATELWKNAKAANRAFRDRFPQGTARDTEARGWLARRLRGQMEPSKFLSEALTSRGRTEALLDAFENPQEREQMRSLLKNHYVNKLLWATRQGAPGERVLNADALALARRNMAPVENAIFTPQESDVLRQHIEAVKDNGKILQRLHSGSSETAALRHYQEQQDTSRAADALTGAAAHAHPLLAMALHMLPAGADRAANQGAIQQRLASALLDPEVYNAIAGTAGKAPGVLGALLKRAPNALYGGLGRWGAFEVPRSLGPQLTAPR